MIFPGFYEREKANYASNTGQIFGEVAYPVLTQGVAYEPFIGLAYVHVGSGSFNEDGGIAALDAGTNDQNVGFSTLGVRLGTGYRWLGVWTTPHASLAWQAAFGGVTPQQSYAFASTGIGFEIGGVPLARNSALLDAGVDFAVAPNATLGLSYAGQLANSVQDNGVRGRFNWKF